ncbi:MAG: transcriptional regulator [Candidatus Aenigmarchaeota archaeon]|nr:transcriptional regulator [Candidatus Aenigmarchaeota archaeon]
MSYENLSKRVEAIERDLEQVKKDLQNIKELLTGPSFYTALNLPDHLRKTYSIAVMLGEAAADDVSLRTKRARAVESAYLNQLVIMGYLEKNKKGRKTYFKRKEQL